MSVRGINKVILIGYLGQNPEIRHMTNGGIVANMVLATSEVWKDKLTNENKEKTEWHRIVVFGKLAELVNNYLHKGSQIYVEGALKTRKWQDQNGRDRYITEIIVNITGTIQILGRRSTENDLNYKNISNKNNIDTKDKKNSNSSSQKSNVNNITDESSVDFDDDIPF